MPCNSSYCKLDIMDVTEPAKISIHHPLDADFMCKILQMNLSCDRN